jgi:hypothetical protein
MFYICCDLQFLPGRTVANSLTSLNIRQQILSKIANNYKRLKCLSLNALQRTILAKLMNTDWFSQGWRRHLQELNTLDYYTK